MKTLLAMLLTVASTVVVGQLQTDHDLKALGNHKQLGVRVELVPDHLGNTAPEEISITPRQAESVQTPQSNGDPMVLVFNTNLSDGTTITLPLFGMVDVTINWGDGFQSVIDTEGLIQYTYAGEGEYTVSISGSLQGFGNWSGYNHAEKLTKVTSFGDLGLVSLAGAFRGAVNLTEVPGVLPGSVTDLFNLFFGATSFNQDIGGWDVSNVTIINQMFWDASSFNQNIGGWNVSGLTSMYGVFSGANAFNQDISSWDVRNVTTMTWMFAEATAFNQNIGGWDVSSVTGMRGMFFAATVFNQNIGGWNVGSVADMKWMFAEATAFNQNIGGWDVSSVTDISYMFTEAMAFDQNIGGWDVSKVTNMAGMFYYASSFNQYIGGWDVGSVTSMWGMFAQATAFNQNVGGWDVSSVTEMTFMFSGASLFNQDIGGWEVRNVTTMLGMFNQTPAFNQDIGGWDVSNVTNMINMFYFATAFNQDLSGWCVQKISSKPDGFDTGASKWALSRPVWGTCPLFNLALSVNPVGAGSISKNPNQSQYHTGQIINLQATPVGDYAFNGWTGDSEHLDNTQMGSVALTMPAKHISLTANFTTTSQVTPEFRTVENTSVSGTESICYDALQTITVSNFLVASGGSVSFVAGESIRLLPGTIVEAGGYLHAHITTDGTFCGSIEKHFLEPEKQPDILAETQEESPEAELPTELPGEFSFKVYPNPTPGAFTLELNTYDQDATIEIYVFGLRGETILRKEVSAAQQLHSLSIEGHQPGMYFIRVLSGQQVGVERIIKR